MAGGRTRARGGAASPGSSAVKSLGRGRLSLSVALEGSEVQRAAGSSGSSGVLANRFAPLSAAAPGEGEELSGSGGLVVDEDDRWARVEAAPLGNGLSSVVALAEDVALAADRQIAEAGVSGSDAIEKGTSSPSVVAGSETHDVVCSREEVMPGNGVSQRAEANQEEEVLAEDGVCPQGVRRNAYVISIDLEDVRRRCKEWEGSVVVRLFGKAVPFFIIEGELRRKWRKFGISKIWAPQFDCLIVKLESTDACEKVIKEGPWKIENQVVGLCRWYPGFKAEHPVGFTTPMWIRFDGLPMEIWGKENLFKLAAAVGKPLWIDEATSLCVKGSFARVCVEIDLLKPLVPSIEYYGLNGIESQMVRYEGLEVFCYECGLVGHGCSECQRSTAKEAPIRSFAQVVASSATRSDEVANPLPVNERTVGPWTRVVSKKSMRFAEKVQQRNVGWPAFRSDRKWNNQVFKEAFMGKGREGGAEPQLGARWIVKDKGGGSAPLCPADEGGDSRGRGLAERSGQPVGAGPSVDIGGCVVLGDNGRNEAVSEERGSGGSGSGLLEVQEQLPGPEGESLERRLRADSQCRSVRGGDGVLNCTPHDQRLKGKGILVCAGSDDCSNRDAGVAAPLVVDA